MSLKEKKSRDTEHIFGSAWVYKSAKADWVKIIPPEIGDIKHSVRSDDHAGWLLCNGREVSKPIYLDLFNVINENFNVGSTSGSTFNLPDARGRVLGGINPSESGSDLATRLLGAKVGEENVTLTVAQMPEHTHTVSSIPSGTQRVVDIGGDLGTVVSDDVATTLTSSSTGNSQAHNNMQPTLFIGNVFIFAKHQTESVRA